MATHQDRIPLGGQQGRAATGGRRSVRRRILLCAWTRRCACRALPDRLQRHPAGRWVFRLQPAGPQGSTGRPSAARLLLGARPAQLHKIASGRSATSTIRSLTWSGVSGLLSPQWRIFRLATSMRMSELSKDRFWTSCRCCSRAASTSRGPRCCCGRSCRAPLSGLGADAARTFADRIRPSWRGPRAARPPAPTVRGRSGCGASARCRPLS